ncbi:MAG: AlpA family phage regulatory protein [Variovorax sp.]|nr:AlpA family phage regulatory protein [Variovorax sp.]
MNPTPTPLQSTSRGVRARQAAPLLGVSLPTYWRYAKRPDFPVARKLSRGVTIWIEDELIAWRDAQLSKGDEA